MISPETLAEQNRIRKDTLWLDLFAGVREWKVRALEGNTMAIEP